MKALVEGTEKSSWFSFWGWLESAEQPNQGYCYVVANIKQRNFMKLWCKIDCHTPFSSTYPEVFAFSFLRYLCGYKAEFVCLAFHEFFRLGPTDQYKVIIRNTMTFTLVCWDCHLLLKNDCTCTARLWRAQHQSVDYWEYEATYPDLLSCLWAR